MLKVRRDKNANKNTSRYDYDFSDYNYSNEYSTFDEVNEEYNIDDIDFDYAYQNYGMYDERGYEEPSEEPRYSSFKAYHKADAKTRSERKGKRKMSASMKALVVVYFAIVTVIACLLIVNALPMMNTNAADMDVKGMDSIEATNVDANAINNVTLADGTVVTVTAMERVPYEYKINSNWFDNMCDWMENLVA